MKKTMQPNPTAAPIATTVHFPDTHREAHELLETILASGDADAADWVTGTLRMFSEAIRGRRADACELNGRLIHKRLELVATREEAR